MAYVQAEDNHVQHFND